MKKCKKKNIIALSLAVTMITSVPMSAFAQNHNVIAATAASAATQSEKRAKPMENVKIFKGDTLEPKNLIKDSEILKVDSYSFKGEKPSTDKVGELKVTVIVKFAENDQEEVPVTLTVIDKNEYVKKIDEAVAKANEAKNGVKQSDTGKDVYAFEKWNTTKKFEELNNEIKNAANAKTHSAVEMVAFVDKLIDITNKFKESTTSGKKEVNKDALTAKITEAENAKQDVIVAAKAEDVEKGKKWVSQSAVDALENAITNAKAINNMDNLREDQVNAEVTKLNTAIETFNSAKKDGTGPTAEEKAEAERLEAKKTELNKLIASAESELNGVRKANDNEYTGGSIDKSKVPNGSKVAKSEQIDNLRNAITNNQPATNDTLETLTGKIAAIKTAKDALIVVTGTKPAQTEADKFVPNTKTLYVKKDGYVNLREGLTNKPSTATVSVTKDVSTKSAGTFYGTIKITFRDGSSRNVTIKVIVENPTKKETLKIIRDEIKNGYFYGIIKDAKGNRIYNATVGLYNPNDRRVDYTTTDRDGRFKIYVGNNYNNYYDGDYGTYDGSKVYYDDYVREYYYYKYDKKVYLGTWRPDRYYNNSDRYNRYYLQAEKSDYYKSEKYYLGYYENSRGYYNETRVYPTSIQRGSYSVSGYVSNYPNRTIEVRDGSRYLGRAVTNSNGYFQVSWNSPYISTSRTLDYFIIGDNKYTSKAPEISEAVAGTKIIKGTAGAYAKVEAIDSNNNRLGDTTADYRGNYTINLNRELKPSERITMRATESNKNTASQDYIIGTRVQSNKETVSRRSYIVGYPDGTFRPQGKVTRAEAAQMFGTLLNGGTNFGTGRITKFSDASNGWYSPAINYAVSKNLISGYEDGTFRPNQNITRAEFAQMISGYVKEGYPGSSSFKDVKGHWASDAIDAVYGNKAIKGYPDGTFKPNQEITRAEAVTILNAVFGRNTKASSIKNISTRNLTTFKDVDSSFWAYYEILDASNSHTSERDKNSTEVEVWK